MNPKTGVKCPTWMDLRRYIQDAEVDNIGIHHASNGCDLHIYDNKMQCNVFLPDDTVPSIAIIFEDRDPLVWLIPVSESGIADYTTQRDRIPANKTIAVTLFDVDPEYRNVEEVRRKLVELLSSDDNSESTEQVDPKAEIMSGYQALIDLCNKTMSGTDALIEMVQHSMGKVRAFRDADAENNTRNLMYQLHSLDNLLSSARRVRDSIQKSLDRANRDVDDITAGD